MSKTIFLNLCKYCNKSFDVPSKTRKVCDDCKRSQLIAIWKLMEAGFTFWRTAKQNESSAQIELLLTETKKTVSKYVTIVGKLPSKSVYITKDAQTFPSSYNTDNHVYEPSKIAERFFEKRLSGELNRSFKEWLDFMSVVNTTIKVTKMQNADLRPLKGGLLNYIQAGITELFDQSSQQFVHIEDIIKKNPRLA